MSKVKLVVILLVIGAIVTVVLQNTETVETKLLFATMEMPRAFLIGVTFLLGVVCGFLLKTRFGKKKKEA